MINENFTNTSPGDELGTHYISVFVKAYTRSDVAARGAIAAVNQKQSSKSG